MMVDEGGEDDAQGLGLFYQGLVWHLLRQRMQELKKVQVQQQIINSVFSMLKLRYLQGIKQRNLINSKIYGSEAKETGLTADMDLGAIHLQM